MEFYHQQQHLGPYLTVSPRHEAGERDRDRDRLLQWSVEETKEFLAMRAELDRSFMETKRNKQLWEAISTGMQQKGFHRTPDQCKSKWKNLVTRFKGSEAMEGDVSRQFPFYEDMRKIYSDRSLVLEKGKGKAVHLQARECEEDEEEAEPNEDEEEENKAATTAATGSSSKRRRMGKKGAEEDVALEIGALKDFARRQLEMEARWLEDAEAREAERRAKDEEWRRAMESLHAERMESERRWREMEEARRARGEARAEKRYGIVMALLEKLWEKGF